MEELNEEGYEIKHEHISINEMEPKDYHDARAIYLNNIGNEFNPAKIKKLPRGFVIEKFINIEDNAKKELKLAIGIAFGDHGFGEKFTEDKPLIIACCLNEKDSFEEIQREVGKILDEMQNDPDCKIENIKKRIKIDYLVVPKKE